MSDLIDAHIEHLSAAGYSPRTIYSRTRILRRIDADLPRGITSPTRTELASWFAPWNGWTLYTYWEAAYTFYTWASAGRQPYLEWNPMEDLRRPKSPRDEPRAATEEHVEIALARLAEPWRTGVLIATLQGLRCAEICALDREHVDVDGIMVDRKGGNSQLLPTHPTVWATLRGLPGGPVVRTRGGERFRPPYYSGCVSEALAAIGIPDVTLHRFRAAFATNLHNRGVPIKVIQNLMGHATMLSTQRYIEVREEQRRLAINTLLLPTGHQKIAA